MRIVKEAAASVLRNEMSELEQQAWRYQSQADKLAGMQLADLSGKAVTTAEQRIRMQAAVARAHMRLCRSLRSADAQNLSLVQGLPTTSPGVLDTAVAQECIDRARRQIRLLQSHMQQAVAQAQVACAQAAASGSATTADVGAIRRQYGMLIDSQRLVVKLNQRILEEAQRYERESLQLYRSVDAGYAEQAELSVQGYLSTGSWGATEWVGRLALDQAVDSYLSSQIELGSNNVVRQFLEGEMKEHDSFAEGSVKTTRRGGALVATGEVLGLDLSVKPYSKKSSKIGEEDKDEKSHGVKAEAKVYAAKGSAKESWDWGSASVSGTVLTGAVSGSVGATLPKAETGGVPGLNAKLESSGSVLSAEVRARVGLEDYNVHAKLGGDVLSAKAEAGVSFGAEGVETKVGAEAYLAKGEISGGLSFLGVTIDVVVEGKAGGAGANAGAAVKLTSVEGELGLGIGLGLGAKVKVDWSGALRALHNLGDAIRSWWRGPQEGKDEDDEV